jgi:hypothetical protein
MWPSEHHAECIYRASTSVPTLADLAQREIRDQVEISLREMKFQDAASKEDVHDALKKLEVFGISLRKDVHDALVRMQTIELSERPIFFQRWRNVYTLLNRTYVLPHRDFSRSYAPGFWAASNVLKRRIKNGDVYNAFDLEGFTLVNLEMRGTDHQFIYDCPSVFELLLLKFLPPEITRKKMQDKHDKRLERIAEQFKNEKDVVGVDERLSLAQTLFVIAGPPATPPP